MTTTLRDDRPAKASRSSRCFCEGGHGQAPGKCYDDQLGSGSGYVYAYSPATGQSYEMWCQQAGSLVTATGGNNALVEFYAG